MDAFQAFYAMYYSKKILDQNAKKIRNELDAVLEGLKQQDEQFKREAEQDALREERSQAALKKILANKKVPAQQLDSPEQGQSPKRR